MPEIPFGVTLKVFNAKVAYSCPKGSTSCIVCRQELDEVAYRLRVPGQERRDVWIHAAFTLPDLPGFG
jgi:hypothetical protein